VELSMEKKIEEKILEIKEINKSFSKGTKKALQNINLQFTPGIYGLLGPNGAGKSTLMRILTDGLKPDTGQILYQGKDIYKMKESYRALLGYMPQQQGMYEDFTALQFMKYMAALKGLSSKDANEQIFALLKQVSLQESMKEKVGNFSGGMKQRLLIAQALLGNPEILIMDEPTAGLDPNERIRLRNFISEIAGNKIVLCATHVVSDIEGIAKEIILLDHGNILCQGSVQDLLTQVEGKVFEFQIEQENERVCRQKYKVKNMCFDHGAYKVRVISDTIPEEDSCISVSPDLEDLYLYKTTTL
jgi:ABC-2 type transport system ATP-binding protein